MAPCITWYNLRPFSLKSEQFENLTPTHTQMTGEAVVVLCALTFHKLSCISKTKHRMHFPSLTFCSFWSNEHNGVHFNKEPHGTIFNFGNIKFHLLDTLRITKMQVRKLYHPGAWEPYLSTRLLLLQSTECQSILIAVFILWEN